MSLQQILLFFLKSQEKVDRLPGIRERFVKICLYCRCACEQKNVGNEFRWNFKYRLIRFVACCFRCRRHGFAAYFLLFLLSRLSNKRFDVYGRIKRYMCSEFVVFFFNTLEKFGCNRAETFLTELPPQMAPTYYFPRKRHAKRIACTRLICFHSKYLFTKTLETAASLIENPHSSWESSIL